MKKILLPLAMMFLLINVYSQDGNTKRYKKPVLHNITLHETSGITLKGYLARATDDSLYVQLPNQPSNNLYRLSPEQVNQITLSRKGAVGKSILVGTGIGVVVGLIVGFADGDDPSSEFLGMSAGEKASVAAISFGGAGAIIGTIIGASARKKFIINGKKENYRLQYDYIVERAMTR